MRVAGVMASRLPGSARTSTSRSAFARDARGSTDACRRASRLAFMAVTGSPELLIVMSAHATGDQVDEVVSRLEEAGANAHVTPGREATVIGAIGERELLAALP